MQDDFQGLDLTGKIAVVSRGENSFYQKLNFAADAGASAILVVNNSPGRARPNLSGYSSSIPFFIVPQAAYNQLVEVQSGEFVQAETPSTEYLQ